MELKIVSFNIRCVDDPNGHAIFERAPRLSTVINAVNPDIIGLQEWRPAWEQYIEKYFGDQYEIFNKIRSLEDSESCMLLWKKDKFDCIKTGYVWLSDTPEVESKGWDEGCNCYRICSYAILMDKESKQQFTFMNTHFGFGDNGQMKSAELLYRYSEKISDHPTCIVGDFNMTPESLGYKTITKYFTDVNAVTAKDMRTTYHGYLLENDYHEHIDYCFITENIKPIQQKMMDTIFDGKFPSDHYGLEIDIEI